MTTNLKAELDAPQVELLQICRRVVSSEMSPDAAFALIKNMKKTNTSVSSLMADVLWLIDMEISMEKKNEDTLKRFSEFLSLISNQIVPDDVLKLELDVLGANEHATRSRVVKMKTKLYFKQLKFNLLREESEGYAKLITELLDTSNLCFNLLREESEGYAKLITELLDTSNLCVSSTLTKLHRLIGQFNLDPNRVLDIILECFEASPQRRRFFISLLADFKASADDLCSILGFKFTFYQQNGDTPSSLYDIAAILCSERVIDLISLCSYLSPKQDGIISEHKARIQRDLRRAKRAEVISTSAVPIEMHPQSTGAVFVDDSLNATIAGVSFASVAAQQDAEDAKLMDCDTSDDVVLAKNQKLGLTYALLMQGAWAFAKQLLDRFPEFYAVNASRCIALSIADMIERSMDDFYQEKCKLGLGEPLAPSLFADTHSLEIVGSWSELISVVLPVLWYLGPYIAYRPSATVKLVRLISVFFDEKAADSELASSTHTDGVANTLIDVIDEVLVPSLSLSELNYALSEEIWRLVSHFPYTLRYRTYAHWRGVHTQRHSLINVQRGRTLGMTRYVVKRLSKETVRMMGRQLGKLCHSHPAVVFDCLLNQIQTFENLIEPVVESIRFLSDLEFDVLSFCIIEHLASPDKQQLKASDGSLSPWLQSLATFVGTPTTGLTSDQLEALSGGQTLRLEAGSFSQVRTNRRAMLRLRDALAKENLMVGLAILIAQQRQCIVFVESNDIPLKLAGKMLDQCQEALVQFGSFIRSNLRQDEYSSRIMSVPELISRYYLSTDAAFFLCRPSFMHRVYNAFDKCRRALRESDGSKTKLDTNRKFAIFKSAFDEELSDLEQKLCCSKFHGNRFCCLFSFIHSNIPSFLHLSKTKRSKEEEQLRGVEKKLSDELKRQGEHSKTKRSKEEEQLRGVEKKLSDELKRQGEHVERVLSILRHDKELLFADCAPNMRGMQMARFLQHCVLPRAIFTDIDAVYCAHFVHLLHQQRTGFFQTVFFFDKLFNDIGIILAALTENEANCFGRFLLLMLEIVQRWHGDKNVFEKECYGFPGFMTKLHTRNADANIENSNGGMNFESYRSLCHKWQFRMARSCVGILNGSSYVLMRNCLIMMTKMLQYFPIIESHISSVQKVVIKVRDAEKGTRNDLSLMAASYASHLHMRKTNVFTESQFHNRSVLNAAKKTTKTIVSKSSDSKRVEAKKAVVKSNEGEIKKPNDIENSKRDVDVKRSNGDVDPAKSSNSSRASQKQEVKSEVEAKKAVVKSNEGEIKKQNGIENSKRDVDMKRSNGDVDPAKSSNSSRASQKQEVKVEQKTLGTINSSDMKKDVTHSKSSVQAIPEDKKRIFDTHESPSKKRLKGPSAEVVAPVSKQSSKSDETKRAREAVVNSKEEPKMEEGEVGASPPSSSHTPLVDSCPSKKMRLSKTVDEEGSRREKEKSKHDEKREERRKQRETPSSLSVSKSKSSVDEYAKLREKSWKRPIDPADANENTTKMARRESGSSERTPESRGSKTVELSPAATRSSSKHHHSRDFQRPCTFTVKEAIYDNGELEPCTSSECDPYERNKVFGGSRNRSEKFSIYDGNRIF
uniref:THO complex subunit 2 n=1 Tax=Ascaris lumbricoides TaxID=6252 RepID=A0A9J2PZ50_ASCLU